MRTPLHVQIRECKTTPEALLLLANAIDELRDAAGDETDVLNWDDPPSIDVPPAAVRGRDQAARGELTDGPVGYKELMPEGYESLARAAQQRKIAGIREKLAEASDPSDIRALEATLRLALEEHVHLPSEAVAPSVGDAVIAEGWSSLAEPATPEQYERRKQWAEDVHLEDYMRTSDALKQARDAGGKDVEDLYSWFGHVGPRGLFVGDHIACMQLPLEARRWLVEQMLEENAVLAKDMGADLLKSEESIDRETAKELYEPTWKA